MKQLSVVVAINAPAATVWEVLTDLRGVERLSPDTGYRVGTSWRETRVMLGQEATEVMTVTAVQPERRTELRAESHGMRYETVVELHPVGALRAPAARTQVVMRFRGGPVRQGPALRLIGALTGPLGAAASRKAMRRDLLDIAAEAERRAVGSPS